jgi:hypothetical protein
MSRTSKSFYFFALFSVILLGAFDQTTVIAQSISTSPPAMEWEHEYGYHFTEITSGLIQTIDGGYVFIDIGWSHGHTLAPSVLYKTDSHGNVEWQKRFNNFTAIAFFQTSDEGFQISGNWNTYGTTYEKTPTLIKCDSTGNIHWVQNYTSKLPAISGSSSKIVLDDGSVISIESGNIVKKDSNGTLQWQIESKFSYYGDTQTELSSLIVTSDGAIAVLGVKVPVGSSMWAGNMYLIKTESFLPKPSPMVLPTPIPTPITISNSTLTLAIITIVVIIVLAISLLLFRRYHKLSFIKKDVEAKHGN